MPLKPEDGDITDAEFQKWASEAAEVLSPKGVKALLKEFEVDKITDLSQEDRKEFVECIEEAQNQTEGEGDATS